MTRLEDNATLDVTATWFVARKTPGRAASLPLCYNGSGFLGRNLLVTATSLMAPLASFFLEGLTIVCMVGTILLWVVFGFLFFAERSLKKD
jgi:hypothetical protein